MFVKLIMEKKATIGLPIISKIREEGMTEADQPWTVLIVLAHIITSQTRHIQASLY